MTDYVRQKGSAAFGTRLRRLSDRLDRQVQAIYRQHDSTFQPRWFAVVSVLREKECLSVGEIASLLGITHAAVSQLRGELIVADILRGSADPNDARRQMLALSPNGKRVVARLAPLWQAIAVATEALCAEGAPGLLAELDAVEAALEREPMSQRVAKARPASR